MFLAGFLPHCVIFFQRQRGIINHKTAVAGQSRAHGLLLHAHKGPADSGCPRRSCRRGAVVPGGSWRALFASPPPLYLSTGQSNRRRPQRAARKGHLDFFVWQGGGRGCGLQPPSRPGGGTGCVPPGVRGIYGVCGRLRWLQLALVPTWCLGARTRLCWWGWHTSCLWPAVGRGTPAIHWPRFQFGVHRWWGWQCSCLPLQHCELLGLPLLGRSWPRRFPAPGLSPPTRRLWRTRLGGRHTGQGHCRSHTALVPWAMASRGGATGPHGSAGLGVLIPGSGEHCKCSTCVATCLGVQQGLRCGGKGCKEHLGRALVSRLACRCHPRMGSPGSGAACSGWTPVMMSCHWRRVKACGS